MVSVSSFALGDENADARIERLIAADANPKALAVVSSDRRIRQAAARRRAQAVTAGEYWDLIDDLKERQSRRTRHDAGTRPALHLERPVPLPGDDDESARWLAIFGDIAEEEDVKQALIPLKSLLTDAEIAELEREVERGMTLQSAAVVAGIPVAAQNRRDRGTTVSEFVPSTAGACGGVDSHLVLQGLLRDEGSRIPGERAAQEGRGRGSGRDRRDRARGGGQGVRCARRRA